MEDIMMFQKSLAFIDKHKKIIALAISVILAILLIMPTPAFACTGMYVGKDLTDDGNTIVARSDDTHPLNKIISMEVVPRIENQPGRSITSKIGYEYKYPETTFKYFSTPRDSSANDGYYGASCTNEYGLLVEATITGYISPEIEALDPRVKVGLGEDTLPNIIAATCKTAREGVERIKEIMKNDGSCECNIAMIADQNETWYIEMYTGHQWAAIKMPTDKMCVFGNQFMIQTEYNNDDNESFMCSDELFSLPQNNNLAVMKNGKMSLCETYAGKDRLADYANLRTYMGHYFFAKSSAGTYNTKTRYDLFFTPDEKVNLSKIFEMYRYRFEGTPYSPDETGAENIRVIGTETQASTHVVQILQDAPQEACEVSWVALANTEHSIFLPYFNIIDKVSDFYRDTKNWDKKKKSNVNDSSEAEEGVIGQAYDASVFDDRSAYVCFKRLCSLAEQDRKYYGSGVRNYWKNQEDEIIQNYKEVLNETLEKYSKSKSDAINYIDNYTINLQQDTLAKANTMFDELSWYIAGSTDTLKYKFNYKTLSMSNEKIPVVPFSPEMKQLEKNKEELSTLIETETIFGYPATWMIISSVLALGVIALIIVLIRKTKKH